MIEFSIPDFWHQSELNSVFIYMMQQHPECFYDDVKIGSTFGSFPCIWNGGRGTYGEFTKKYAYDIIEYFNSRGIEIRHTFTNRFISKDGKYDRIGNLICEMSTELGEKYNITNKCNIYDENLAEYISKTYPNLQIIYSTTKELKTLEQINHYSQNNLTIPSYNINHDMVLLSQLKYPENIELLCIETGCIKNCPYRIVHQDHVSSTIMQIDEENPFDMDTQCPVKDHNWYKSYNDPDVFISIEQIRNLYLPLKLNQFKISGRGPNMHNLFSNLESFLHFFVKPEYQGYIRIEVLEKTIYEQFTHVGALYY